MIESAWKKDVFSGPRPVLPAGTNTSMGAMAPALAGAATYTSHQWQLSRLQVCPLTLLACIKSLTSFKSSLVNTKPILPLICGNNFSSCGFFSRCPRIAFLIIVFLPINTTTECHNIKLQYQPISLLAVPLRELLICCICFDPTLSAPTINTLGYSSNSC